MHSSRSQRSDQRSNKAASPLTTWAMTHLFMRGEMISFSEWWEAEEVFMRAEGADDEIILGAMRSIASTAWNDAIDAARSEEHTSELQSRGHIVCRLLLA